MLLLIPSEFTPVKDSQWVSWACLWSPVQNTVVFTAAFYLHSGLDLSFEKPQSNTFNVIIQPKLFSPRLHSDFVLKLNSAWGALSDFILFCKLRIFKTFMSEVSCVALLITLWLYGIELELLVCMHIEFILAPMRKDLGCKKLLFCTILQTILKTILNQDTFTWEENWHKILGLVFLPMRWEKSQLWQIFFLVLCICNFVQ